MSSCCRDAQLVVPDESPVRDRPDEERVQLRIGATDEVSLEIDDKTEIEREKEVGWFGGYTEYNLPVV